MKQLGNRCKVIVIHGTTDDACPVADAREMAANLRDAGLDVEGHFITEADFEPGVVTNTGHSVGDRTKIVLKFAGRYLTPGSPELLVRQGPSDFERRDEAVRYPAHGGVFVISYKQGYPSDGSKRRRIGCVSHEPTEIGGANQLGGAVRSTHLTPEEVNDERENVSGRR